MEQEHDVFAEMLPYSSNNFSNPSSSYSTANKIITWSRQIIARCVGAANL